MNSNTLMYATVLALSALVTASCAEQSTKIAATSDYQSRSAVEVSTKVEYKDEDSSVNLDLFSKRFDWDKLQRQQGDPALGPDSAEVALLVFSDYACEYSRDMAPIILAFAEENPDLQIIYKLLPVLGDSSDYAARASIAAARQDGWREFHARLMNSRPGINVDEAIQQAAEGAGLDVEQLERDMAIPELSTIIKDNSVLATELGLTGTPGFVIRNALAGVDHAVSGVVSGEYLKAWLELKRDVVEEYAFLFQGDAPYDSYEIEQLNKDYDEALRLDPDNALVYGSRGDARYNMGDFEQAIKDYDEALRRDPDNAGVYINRGGARYNMGDFEQAIKDYDEALRLDPDNALVYGSRGDARFKRGDFEQAIKDYDEALRLDPDNALVYGSRGDARYNMGDFEQAIKDYDEALRLDPDNALVYGSRGDARYNMGDFEQAIKDYDEALRRDPDNALVYGSRGEARYNMGDFEQAIKDYDEALRRDPDNAGVYINRGDARYNMGDFEQAIKDYDEALRRDPDNAGVYINRGDARYNMGDFEQAIKDYDEALRRDPDNAGVYINRGGARYNMGDFEQAIKDYDEALRRDPDNAGVYINRGDARYNMGDFEQALLDYEEALRLDSGDLWTQNTLAWILATGPNHLRDGQRSVDLARQALSMEDQPYIRDTLAAALAEVGEYEAAILEYEAVISEDPLLLQDYQKILKGMGYDSVKINNMYDAATSGALHACVRAGCQLVITK